MLHRPTALIADDEPLLRRHLQGLLQEVWPDLQIVALACDGEEAWDLILEHQPDIAFLDIRMPGQTGIELVQNFRQLAKAPLVVFTTAYDQHAVEAFENEAVDYLLKPLEESRLEKAIARLKQRLQQPVEGVDLQKIHHLLSQLMPAASQDSQSKAPSKLQWIKASQRDTVHMLDVQHVDYFLAEDKYTTVHSQGQEYLIRTPISTLEQQLDEELFWRVHRSCIVRVAQIGKVVRDELGHMSLFLRHSNQELPVSRAYQHLFRQM